MPEHESISAYLDAVSDQIRWNRARRLVIPELRQHLEDQRDAFLAEGIGDAERRAVEEMGDPVAVGAELDRIHRPKPQWALLALTAVLALAGMLLRIWVAADSDGTGRAALSFALGCAALLAGYFLDVSFLSRRPRAVCAGAAGLLQGETDQRLRELVQVRRCWPLPWQRCRSSIARAPFPRFSCPISACSCPRLMPAGSIPAGGAGGPACWPHWQGLSPCWRSPAPAGTGWL